MSAKGQESDTSKRTKEREQEPQKQRPSRTRMNSSTNIRGNSTRHNPSNPSSVASSRESSPPPTASSSKVQLPASKPVSQTASFATKDPEADQDKRGLTVSRHNTSSPNPHRRRSKSPVDTFSKALRKVIMTRAECDFQSREERVNPILMANWSIAAFGDTTTPFASPDRLMSEITEGDKWSNILATFESAEQPLTQRFQDNEDALASKVNHLRTEYATLYRQWQADCAYLEKKERKLNVKEAEFIPLTGRSTRSTRNGDVIATDHDMEQVMSVLQQSELTNPARLCKKNLAGIPDMIEVTQGPVRYVYDDTNHLVTDPSTYYGATTGLEDWTEEEKETFNDKFAAFPKQFGIIADYLPNKTPAQCVDYYYLHKKTHIDFRAVVAERAPGGKRRRRGTGKQRGNALLADIRQHDAEVHRDDANNKGKMILRNRPAKVDDPSTATPTPEPESRPKRKRVTIATDQLQAEEEEDSSKNVKKPARKPRRSKGAAESTDNSRRKSTGQITWTNEDKAQFILLLARYGSDFKRIAASMTNKTSVQIAAFYKTNKRSLSLDEIVAGVEQSATPDSDTPEAGPSTLQVAS